uniref:Uncharacterized protein n=1 Tax=Arundo donax TaxID=35708 RepID=A0A0A9EM83_ARUDO
MVSIPSSLSLSLLLPLFPTTPPSSPSLPCLPLDRSGSFFLRRSLLRSCDE